MKAGTIKTAVLATLLAAAPALAQDMPDIGFKSVGRGRPLAGSVNGMPEVGPNWIRQFGQRYDPEHPFPLNGYKHDALPKNYKPLPRDVFTSDDFYKDKTINVVVGLSTGGGYDLYGRTLARHLGKHIPGNPKLVVQNMPGAGSLTSVLWLENVAPRDGTTMLIFNHGLIGDSVLSPEKGRVDFRRFA